MRDPTGGGKEARNLADTDSPMQRVTSEEMPHRIEACPTFADWIYTKSAEAKRRSKCRLRAGMRPPCETRLGEELHLRRLDGDQEVQLPSAAAFADLSELDGFFESC